MSNNLIDSGYVIIKNRDLVTEELTERIVDVMIDSECNEVIEPYFFLYKYGQADRTMYYSIPAEAMNHKNTYDNTLELTGNNMGSKSSVLKYLDKIYLPQIHPSCYLDSLITKPTLTEVCTGSENNSSTYSMGHIYLMLKEGDYELNLYSRKNKLDFLTSHDEDSTSSRVSLLESPISLTNINAKIRSIVITLSQDVSEINYGRAIYGDEAKMPIKWVISSDSKSVRDLPSIDFIQSLSTSPISTSFNRLQSMKIDIGSESDLINFDSDPIKDINLVISSTEIKINDVILENEKPF